MKSHGRAPLASLALTLSALTIGVGVPSCGDTPGALHPPVIAFLRVETTNVTPGLTISVEVEVENAVSNLGYAWEATGGSFSRDNVAATSWTAPAEEGDYDLTVTVTGRGSAALSTRIHVGALEDQDGDGFAVLQGDCNDAQADIHPGSPEGTDGIDNDCDGLIDEGAEDADDDGDGYTDLAGDCDDTRASIHPGAEEHVDQTDEDCDGIVDDHTSAYDDDGDGFSEEMGDCDDANGGVGPAATEFLDSVDNDCDGVTDENTVGSDDDGDGFSELQGDCNDGDSDSWPGAVELPDGDDNDCNGIIDDGSIISDDDGDGATDLFGDCDDSNPYTYPGAPEYLDGTDNDCDGEVDEGLDGTDDDGDGYAEAQGDCNDNNAQIHPGAIEIDDFIDNDCNGLGYTNPPVAIAIKDGDAIACGAVALSGRNSYDPDGDTLDFTWFFTTKPAVSARTDDDIANRYEMNASFIPDAAGYWALGLLVTDGVYTSSVASVGFAVAAVAGNQPPIVTFDQGDINGMNMSSCTIDSYLNCTGCTPCQPTYSLSVLSAVDPEGGPLWFTWDAVKVSGDGAPPELTVTSDGRSATVALDLNVTCGGVSSGLFQVTAEAHDCNGAVASDMVNINYTCDAP